MPHAAFPCAQCIPGGPTGMLGLKLKIISSGCFSQKPPNISWTLFPKSRKTIRKPLQQRLPLVHENIQLTTAIFHGSQQPSLWVNFIITISSSQLLSLLGFARYDFFLTRQELMTQPPAIPASLPRSLPPGWKSCRQNHLRHAVQLPANQAVPIQPAHAFANHSIHWHRNFCSVCRRQNPPGQPVPACK